MLAQLLYYPLFACLQHNLPVSSLITHFFFLCCLHFLLDHLGVPIDLDLIFDGNTTGKTDDNAEQTVQLRPKAPSKPPRTFVSTDLDNPNSRIDLLGEYQNKER